MEGRLRIEKRVSGVLGVMILLASGGALLVFFCNPETSAWYPHCAFFALTGILCPGCGTTRAVYALLHGDILRSMQGNLLMFIYGIWIIGIVFRRKYPRMRGVAMVLLVSFVYTVVRNTDTALALVLKP